MTEAIITVGKKDNNQPVKKQREHAKDVRRMKIAAIIEARMTSTRLPGKILLPMVGKPALELLIERLRRATLLDEIIVATTDNPTDDIVEELTGRLGVNCFRGSEDDVLGRVLKAAHAFSVTTIVEITGDCPLIEPLVVDRVIDTYLNNSFDYVSNTLKETYPNGLDTQVFATAILDKVAKMTNDPADHEHVSLYIYEHPDLFSLHNIESDLPERYWNARLTLDTKEDYELIKKIYEELYPANPKFTIYDIVRLLDARPDLLGINKHIIQKATR